MCNSRCWIISLLFLLIACNRAGPSSGPNDFVPDPLHPSEAKDALEVIYSLSLPIDIIDIFTETGTGFSPEFTIPLDLISLYEDQGQMALLIGALGVDLSYCRLFERTTESGDIYKNIEVLAYNLDLPGDIFDKSSDELEWYVNRPDSLTKLINQIYGDVDASFREQNQESLASLSLLGGWLEAMYIGVRIYQDKSVLDMGDRILQQKYALNSLAALLSNYQESLVIRSYIHLLTNLKEVYDSVEISLSEEGTVTEISYEPETLNEICRLIIQIREGVI
ncbi:MAG: hypothetical protein ABFS28_14870 [Bacteroidota bacterium]